MTDEPNPDTESGREYEFSAAQNQTFATLADIIRFVSVLILLLGGLGIAAGALNLSIGDRETVTAALMIGEGLFGVLIGVWLRLAAGAFDDVATTAGADISNLMYALGQLARVFRLQAWLLGLGLLLAFGALAMSLFGALLAG